MSDGLAPAALQVFLDGMIDYAGLFPPASLDMLSCMDHYRHYLTGKDHWALGRFCLPVSRLDEFLNAQENDVADAPWRLTGILSADIAAELDAVREFNGKAPGAVMDTVEIKVEGSEEVAAVAAQLPTGVSAFYEMTPERASVLLPEVRKMRGRAKIRTGGVVSGAFPTIVEIATFLCSCAEAGVAFKATAGLHHPVRGEHSLTYEPHAAKAVMHGFLNVYTAAAMAWSARQAGTELRLPWLIRCLADGDPANWHFNDRALMWSGGDEPMRIELDCLRAIRTDFAISFGSCSFVEPIGELRELNLL